MRVVFADTLYWGAVIVPGDEYSDVARSVRLALGAVHIVTIDEVLIEVLSLAAGKGSYIRTLACESVESLMRNQSVTVHPQSRRTLLDGLDLYRKRADKGYSLVDCISMNTMRRLQITDILTDDHHFKQEGFTILLSPAPH